MTSGFIQILIEDSTVQTAVGSHANKYKVFPVVAPQETPQKFVTVEKKSNQPTLAKDCLSRLDTSEYEVRSWAKNFRDTETLHEVCRTALESTSEVVTDACTFKKIWMTNDYDGFDETLEMYCHIGVYSANVVR